MENSLLKCTTRHVRIFTAILQDEELIEDSNHLTLDLDPDNEFVWNDSAVKKIQDYFVERVDAAAGKELSDYMLRKIGSDLESKIRQLLQAGEISYNPDGRVLNYSMVLPRTPELL